MMSIRYKKHLEHQMNWNRRNPPTKHIIKTLKIEQKKRILKAHREKDWGLYEGRLRITLKSSMETLKGKKDLDRYSTKSEDYRWKLSIT